MKIVSVAADAGAGGGGFAAGIYRGRAAAARRPGRRRRSLSRWCTPGERVAVLVGHGNNGRDGAVAADWLLGSRRRSTWCWRPATPLTSDELAGLQARGASVTSSRHRGRRRRRFWAMPASRSMRWPASARAAPLREPLASLAATAERRPTRTPTALAGAWRSTCPAASMPTRAQSPGEAVWADTTVTLGGVKQGLLRFPAAERVGR